MSDISAIETCDIDSEGVFKYILIKVSSVELKEQTSSSKIIVRGYKRCAYHAATLNSSDLNQILGFNFNYFSCELFSNSLSLNVKSISRHFRIAGSSSVLYAAPNFVPIREQLVRFTSRVFYDFVYVDVETGIEQT